MLVTCWLLHTMALPLRQFLYRIHQRSFIPTTTSIATSSTSSMYLFKAAASKFRSFTSPSRAPPSLQADTTAPHVVIPFDDAINIAQINDDGGEHFTCDEEPFMVGLPHTPGYMPIQFGALLEGDNHKYKVLRKLGWGTASSVWLAQRLGSCDESKFFAIKVLTCSASTAIFQKFSHELDVLAAIRGDRGNHPGKSLCVTGVDILAEESVHGGHLCIVTEPYAISFLHLLRQSSVNGFDRGLVAKTVVKQVLLALDFLHSLGYVHTDIKTDNLLLPLKGQQKEIAAWLKDHPSSTYPPRNEPSLWPEPIITSKSEPLPPLGLKLPDALVVHLSDYGSAIPESKISPGMYAMPTVLRAPEIILEHPWGKPVDVWAVGCMALELITGQQVFNIDRTADLSFTEVHLARIADLVGPFSPQFLSACRLRADFFDDAGNLLRKPILSHHNSIAERIASAGLRDEELANASAFVRRALSIDPSERPSASALLADEWLKL
ncbi:hypothetical protein HGRIS_005489 [Hohenbuehelia grisea]|uniref:non-specific serine/threonine protein kinase n=1 Tax=Hohenbuehelia grisea TaxID=104357 RepID=A0ABR3JZ23_9AGAR